ncbi:Utp14-domain-containing protein [Sistotremastrum suecicum HHB10207 ss-3]|uniref:Utp14-domain-containing protein n=1 Tax=Sistotremastrum suecicum HHB10207 ss-3 TaxID=1314776 RepID=A0A166IK95_9AGAM|nr:Utp14-domain-containing protein [Sistotremastrum suecicum HHB10207 ss-3]
MSLRASKSKSHASGSKSKANALGFQKRQARKPTKIQPSSDIYDNGGSGRSRRANVSMLLEPEERLGLGPEDEGENAQLKERIIALTRDDNVVIEDEDDEEIDSDDAFQESDEERFAEFRFTQKKRHNRPRTKSTVKEIDLDEDEEGSESDVSGQDISDGSGEGFFDALDILDGRNISSEEKETTSKRPARRSAVESQEHSVSSDEDDDVDMDEEEEEDILPSDSDEKADMDESALDRLRERVVALDTNVKRKVDELDNGQASDRPVRKRKLLNDQTAGGPEGEFSSQLVSGKLTLEDLLAPLASSSDALRDLKKNTKALASSTEENNALPVPLPLRLQERLDREAAFEQTKEEVDKWKSTMKQIKEAEHLSFPLQAPSISKTSTNELAAKFTPTTSLETAVDRLLQKARLREEDILKTEELQTNHLSTEEVAARRAELKKMREIMFRADIKSKRISKIKSKTYRKIQRKGREKEITKLREAGLLDDNDDPEAEQLEREVARAKERATLRHKNTGKWAKAMNRRAGADVDQRREITEQLERGELLLEKIQGGADESSSDSEAELGDFVSQAIGDVDGYAAQQGDAEDSSHKAKSVFNMKFMREAREREERAAQQRADDFRAEMEMFTGDGAETTPLVSVVERTGGRIRIQPIDTAPMKPSGGIDAPSVASDRSTTTLKSSEVPEDYSKSLSPPAPNEAYLRDQNVEENPWLLSRGPSRALTKRHETVVDKSSSAVEKASVALKKANSKTVEERRAALEDATVDLVLDDVLELPAEPVANKKRSQVPRQSKDTRATSSDDSDQNSEVDEQESRENISRKRPVFKQRDLVALAFAGDNVIQDFEQAKKRIIEEDAPRQEDTTLAGWGSWGGKGTKKTIPKPHLVKKIAGVDPSNRADFKKTHVIISERKDSKASKYQIKDLPYPYTSKAQYERSLEMPVGTEWNTRTGFQRGTLPKVVKKMGTIIAPLHKMS